MTRTEENDLRRRHRATGLMLTAGDLLLTGRCVEPWQERLCQRVLVNNHRELVCLGYGAQGAMVLASIRDQMHERAS